MTSDNTRRNPGTPLRKIITYSTGEGATSLTMNGIAAFAMLYYVQVLGLNCKWAGLALSISMLWDAISGPIFAALALLIILIYPVNRKFMMKIKAELAVREAGAKISLRN